MTAGELLNHLRLKLVSMGEMPPIDEVLLSYLNQRYVDFVSTMEGVPDTEEVDIDPGESEFTLPEYVLKIYSAQDEDENFIDILNRSDTRHNEFDGQFGVVGDLKFIMIGTDQTTVKYANSPATSQVLYLDVDRLPKSSLTTEASKPVDVATRYHLYLVDGAAALVLANSDKRDMRNEAAKLETKFFAVAEEARRKKAKRKSKKTRLVAYGGL